MATIYMLNNSPPPPPEIESHLFFTVHAQDPLLCMLYAPHQKYMQVSLHNFEIHSQLIHALLMVVNFEFFHNKSFKNSQLKNKMEI